MPTREYLEAALEKAKQLLPEWAWNAIHRAALPSAGGRAAHRSPDEPAALEKLAVADMRPSVLRGVSDQELLQAHHRLHQLYGGAKRAGRAIEDYVNAHLFVEAEMRHRGMQLDPDDELSAEAEALRKAVLIPEAWDLPDEVVVVPGFCSIVGSSVDKGADAGDLDVLIRAPWVHRDDEDAPYLLLQAHSVTLPLRKVLDPAKTGRIHWVPSPQGPHADAIELYDLVLRRKRVFQRQVVKSEDAPDPLYPVGSRVRIASPHGEDHMIGVVREVVYGYTYGVVIEGQEEQGVHRWYVEGDLQPVVEKAAPAMPDWERWLDEAPDGKRVDLGPGEGGPPEGFRGLGRPEADLDAPWPLADGTVAVLRANHVLEHLSDPAHAMSEAWRVLMPGGLLMATVPAAGSRGDAAHPEHRSRWSADTFRFYTDAELLKTVDRRPPAPFDLLHLEEHDMGDGRRYVHVVLRKPNVVKQERALKPIMKFPMQKPAMKGFAHTDAYAVDEVWPWVERHLQNGVVVEEKLNGFRAALQKAGNRVSIFFEDSQEERNRQLPEIAEALRRIPGDFILDADIGVEENGRRWPRIQLMTLTADRPEIPEGARPIATVFDLLYWSEAGGDVHKRPFRERRELLERFFGRLLRGGPFRITQQVAIRTREGLERAWRTLGSRPMSEGIVLKDLEAPFSLSGATDGMAKIKRVLEVKALVLETHRNKDGTYGFRGGLLAGEAGFRNTTEFRGRSFVDLGWSFNAPFRADVGDVVTFQVQEIQQLKDGRLAWLGAKPLDVDKARKEPYFAGQVVDMAERAGVLQIQKQERPPSDEGEERGPRAEAAAQYWRENWWKALPKSGRGRWVLHAHWRGLSEDEAKLDFDDLLKTDHSLHFDLRLEGEGGLWGWSIFAGTTAENRPIPRIFRLGQDERMQVAPKLQQPEEWLEVGRRQPLVVEPGGVGSTSRTYSKFFALDSGTYRLGVANRHFVELFLDGQRLKGRYLIQSAEQPGRRFWILTKPEDQRPYAETHDRDKVIEELRQRGHEMLVWAKPGERPEVIRIRAAKQERFQRVVEVWTDKADEKQIVYGVVLVPGLRDSQGDIVTAEDIEEAAHRFLVKSRRVGVQHERLARAEVVESYVAPTDLAVADRRVPKGAWVVAVHVLDPNLWARVKRGELTGFSIGGSGVREEVKSYDNAA